jgi:hypothetical protein
MLMSGLKDLVESLGGTALMGGILIQFSDTAFEQAVKKIYEMGVEAEREACAKIGDDHPSWSSRMYSATIRARNAT